MASLSGLSKYIKSTLTKWVMGTPSEFSYTRFSDEFIDRTVENIYKRILTESLERIVIDEQTDRDGVRLTCYDSFSPYNRGLISWIVEAISQQRRIFLKSQQVGGERDWFIFTETNSTEALMQVDGGTSINRGYVDLDFRKYEDAELIKLLVTLISALMDAMSKGIKVSSTLLFKINRLSEMIDKPESREPLTQQIKQINKGLTEGNGAFVDSGSSVGYTPYDSSPIESAQNVIYGMISNVIGLSRSTLFGEVVTGLGSGDNGDSERDNRAYKMFHYSILFGIFYNVYGKKFGYANPDDIDKTQKVLDLVESAGIINHDGKVNFIIANTQFKRDEIMLEDDYEGSSNGDGDNTDRTSVEGFSGDGVQDQSAGQPESDSIDDSTSQVS